MFSKKINIFKKETFTIDEKYFISKQIKNFSLKDLDIDFLKLQNIAEHNSYNSISNRSKIGNNIVDHFTFIERLETKGKYNVNFFEFLTNIEEFKQKKYIQTMLKYYETKKTKNYYTLMKEVYNICISAINIMRPLNCMEYYSKYNAKRVLNFCAGWGGGLVASYILSNINNTNNTNNTNNNIMAYYGIEININLKVPYDNMIKYLKEKTLNNNFEAKMYFEDAVKFDYSKLDYDFVFSSPPYYFLEKYSNNINFNSKKEMEENFYKPLFTKTYENLKQNGYYCINICSEVYENVLKKLHGEATEIIPFKKSKRQNNYTEFVYIWHKI